MGKKRSEENKKLPANLYCSGGYYSYKHPVTKKHVGLGRNKVSAVRSANAANRVISANTIVNRYAEGLMDMLSHEEIVLAALSRATLCGVYFLVKEARVVYVGQPSNIHKRIAVHIAEGEKQFDSFHFVECHKSILDEVEAAYIVALNPPQNRVVSMVKARIAIGSTVQEHSAVCGRSKTGISQGLTGPHAASIPGLNNQVVTE